jgi:hypothetical protein
MRRQETFGRADVPVLPLPQPTEASGMSSAGYIYITNWEQFQGRRDRNDPWHKVYNDLLRHDAYIDLTLAQRGLLHGIWMLASSTGDGRVRYTRRTLGRHLNATRVSLEPLIDAGFIEIRAAKAPRTRALEEKRVEESREKLLDLSRNRSSRAQGTATEQNGQKPELPGALAKILDAKIAASLTNAQIELATRAWFEGVQLRHSMADIEAAENPTAMFVSVCKRISPSSPAQHEASLAAKRKGAVQRCRYLWHAGLEEGDDEIALREHLEREYRHDPSIVLEAIGTQ